MRCFRCVAVGSSCGVVAIVCTPYPTLQTYTTGPKVIERGRHRQNRDHGCSCWKYDETWRAYCVIWRFFHFSNDNERNRWKKNRYYFSQFWYFEKSLFKRKLRKSITNGLTTRDFKFRSDILFITYSSKPYLTSIFLLSTHEPDPSDPWERGKWLPGGTAMVIYPKKMSNKDGWSLKTDS